MPRKQRQPASDFHSPRGPAALFYRADVAWLVFDARPIDIEPIRREGGSLVGGQAIRWRRARHPHPPQPPQLAAEERRRGQCRPQLGGDVRGSMQTPVQPLVALRNIADPANATVAVPLTNPGLLHRVIDPDAGDALMVITAPPPARGFVKRQDFVEFSLLESTHGVVIAPNSDEVVAEIAANRITLSRPGGLTLSSSSAVPQRASAVVRPIFDGNEWRRNQQQPFGERLDTLVNTASVASGNQRTAARLDLARFYVARTMYPEAKGILDLVLDDPKPGQDFPAALMTHAIASTLMGRPELSLKDLANPVIAANYDAQLWKALAFARQEKWIEAREKFKNIEFAVTSLPIELQRLAISQAMRASLEAKDYSGAAARSSELELLDVPAEIKPGILVMQGRLRGSGTRQGCAHQVPRGRRVFQSPGRQRGQAPGNRSAAEARRDQSG